MVKFNVVANSPNTKILPAPPSLTRSLMAGFDAVTTHLGLILFSVIFDLLLWLGPKFRLLALVEGFFDQLTSLPELNSAEVMDSINFARGFWVEFAGSFNLLFFFRALPVGIPSLMVSRSPVESPIGAPLFYEVNSTGLALGLMIFFVVIGLLAGTVYFSLISQAAVSGEISIVNMARILPWTFVQVLLMSMLTFLLCIATVIPFSCIMSVLLMSGLGFDRFGFILFFIMGGLFLWWMLPLFFTPHGIFINHRVLWDSIRDSIRITRSTLPAPGFLFLIIVVLSEGLKLLWRVPPANSWFALIGVLGHSFIAAGLIAASFVFYKDADQWMSSEPAVSTN